MTATLYFVAIFAPVAFTMHNLIIRSRLLFLSDGMLGKAHRLFYSSALIVLFTATSLLAQNTASLTGIVVNEEGTPVPGASVRYQGGNCTAWFHVPGCSPVAGIVTADTSGQFTIGSLAADTYSICAWSANANQLATCEWAGFGVYTGPGFVAVQTGQSVTGLKFVLRNATVIKIHVSDPGKWLTGQNRLPLSIGSSIDNGTVHSFTSPNDLSTPQTDLIYTRSAPRGYSVGIILGTPLVVFDNTGTSIPQGTPSAISVTTGPAQADVYVTVSSALVNSANYTPGLPNDGLASLFASGTTAVNGIVAAERFPLPTVLAGTSVTVNGVTAPLLAVANVNGQEQINFLVPAGTTRPAKIEVNTNGVSHVFYGPSTGGAAGVFSNAQGQLLITHLNGELVTSANPASSGELIVVYGTGFGCVSSPPPDGMPAPISPLSECPPGVPFGSVFLGNGLYADVNVVWAGLTPGFAGLYQLNVQLPQNLPGGNLQLGLGSGWPNTIVMIPVK